MKEIPNLVLKLTTLTRVYNRIVETQKAVKIAKVQIHKDFANMDPEAKFFSNPISYEFDFDKMLREARV